MQYSGALTFSRVALISAIAWLSFALCGSALHARASTRSISAVRAAGLESCLYLADSDDPALISNEAAPSAVNPPVIFLHYDYMGLSPYGYDLRPNPDNIRRVVEAFRAQGLQLIIDPRHTVLPWHQFLSFGPCLPGLTNCVDFYALKALYFNPPPGITWHYAIIGDLGSYGGFAELPGYNFQVTNGPDQSCFDPSFGFDLCQNSIAGTLMHELGHNLNLRHGGDEDVNYKPNYVSAMNYLYQAGIPIADAPGSTNVIGLRLDYSSYVLPTLTQAHLDERVGMSGPSTSTDVGFWFDQDISEHFAPVATGPIDWNLDGAIEPDVAVNLNPLDSPGLGPLHSFNDWSYLQKYLNTPEYKTGQVRRGPPVP